MNQERPSDVPYSVSDAGCLVFRNGRGVVNFDSRRDAINAASLANRSHAEGRKAAEKETQISAPAGWGEKGLSPLREEQKKEAFNFLWKHANRAGHKMDEKEKDFKELLEIAEALHGDIDFISTSTQDFAAWKKARGIE